MLLFGISHLYICRYKDRKLRRYRIAVVASVFFVIFEKVIIIITVVNMALKVGDKIPEILGVNQYGEEVKAKDLAGKKLVLYFYPKDSTPGCTAEACSLRDGYERLRVAGYEVIGVSKDSIKSHQKFIEKQDLPFQLIADTDTTLNQVFGVWAEKKMAGRTYMGTLRTTFLIDENGIVEKIIDKVDTKRHAEQILDDKLR